MLELLIMAHLLFNICGSSWCNYTVPTAQSQGSIGCVFYTVISNFDWYYDVFLVVIYVCLFMIFGYVQGREKYISVTFLGFIFTTISEGYNITCGSLPALSLVTSYQWGISLFLLLFTIMVVRLVGR
jgi:hypothetical protein